MLKRTHKATPAKPVKEVPYDLPVCSCGHTHHQHGPTKDGRCTAWACRCPKFSLLKPTVT
jgi:hypothetical protein